MLLARLVNIVNYLFTFMWVFTLSALLITIKTGYQYLSKMFDLPVDVILALSQVKRIRDEAKDKKVQK